MKRAGFRAPRHCRTASLGSVRLLLRRALQRYNPAERHPALTGPEERGREPEWLVSAAQTADAFGRRQRRAVLMHGVARP